MKRYGNLWKDIITPENIYLAYLKARIGKSSRNAVIKFDRNIEENLQEIKSSLVNKTFTTSSYKIRTVFEPKRREIFILPFSPDRIVQHALMNVVEPLMDKRMYYHSYACRPGKGIHVGCIATMQYVMSNKFALKMDVSKFYPSIPHKKMMDKLENIFKDKDVLWLFDDIVNSINGETNLPIGNYVSQWLGNLYLTELDNFVKHYLRCKAYIRYCDDFILFHNDKSVLQEWRLIVDQFLNEELILRLSKNDLFPTSHGIDFLGYRFFPKNNNGKKQGVVLLRKRTAKTMKKRINQMWANVIAGKGNPAHMYASLMSMSGWLKWAQTENFKECLQMYQLEAILREKFNDYENENKLLTV